MKNWLSPIRILLLFLAVLAMLGSWSWGGLDPVFWLLQIRNFLLIGCTGLFAYEILIRTPFAKPTRWENHFITCLILFLLFEPGLPWWSYMTLGLVTELIQRLIRVPTGPFANPAASGALLCSLFGLLPGWWGVSFSPRLEIFPGGMSIAMFLILPLAGYVAYTYKKLSVSLIAAVVFSILYFIFFQSNPLFLVAEGTLAFFLLVMAVEPKTTPVLKNQQYLFGAFLGMMIVFFQKIAFVEPFCGALVLTNVLFNLYRHRQALKQKFLPSASQAQITLSD